MSVCAHDPHCPGYGPAHERGLSGAPLVPGSAPLSRTKTKRLERAARRTERAWYTTNH